MACKDAKGRLRVAAGVGITPDALDRVKALVEEDVDAVVLDGDLREASAAASDQLADEGASAFKPAEPDEFGANPDDDFAQDALF